MLLNAPATPDQDPSQLKSKSLHSQLLETASERLKVHGPRLQQVPLLRGLLQCYSNSFATFLPLVTGLQGNFPVFAKGTVPPPPPRSSPCSPVQQQPFPLVEGSMTSKQLMCSSFLPRAQLQSVEDCPANPVAKLSCPRLGLAPLLPNPRGQGSCARCSELLTPRRVFTSLWLSLPPSSSLAASPSRRGPKNSLAITPGADDLPRESPSLSISPRLEVSKGG